MSAQNVIELGFNVEQLSAEKKQVLDLMVDLFQQLEKYDGTKFNPLGDGGIAELKKSMVEGAAAMKEFQDKVANYNKVVTEQYQKGQQAAKEYGSTVTQTAQATSKAAGEMSVAYADQEGSLRENIELLVKYKTALATNQEAQKQFKKELDSGAISTEEFNEKMVNATQRQLELKNSIAEVNKELKSYGEIDISIPNSIADAKAQNKVLTRQRDNTDVGDQETINRLNALIDQNNALIDANSDKLAKQKINIGNYTGAVVILESSLGNIGRQLESMAASGDVSSEAFQKLTLEQKILQSLMEKQTAGFANVNQELKATKNALDTLTVAGLEQSETFQKLNLEYTAAKQKVMELHDEQKILTAEEPGFTALAAAARGLGGGYAVATGAAAIFGSENEKVQQQLNKLVAVMTVLQGLEEAVKAVKDRGAIATALQGQATKLLNFVKEIEIKLFGQAIAVTEASTVAKTINTETQVANTAALEGNAAGAAINTAAMEGTAIATEEASAATIGFRTVLVSTGIGAIVIGIIYGITKLVGAIGDWINADEKAIETQKELAQTSKELFEINNQLNDALEEGAKKVLNSLEKRDAFLKAGNQNQFIQLANERAIALQRQKIAQDQLDRLGVNEAKIKEFDDKKKANLFTLKELEKNVADAKKAGDKDEIEDAQKILDANKAVFDLFETKYNTVMTLRKEVNDQASKLDENAITQQRASAELAAKLAADAAQRRYEYAKDANERILNDERSTEEQKLNAVSKGLQAEKDLAGSQIIAVRKQMADRVITEEEGSNEIANIENALTLKRKKATEDRNKIIREYNDREINAQVAINKNILEADAAVQTAITKDQQKELEARLTALKKNIDDRTKVIEEDYRNRVRLAVETGRTETEIEALYSERAKALVDLTADTQKQIYDITISYGDRRLKAIQDSNKATDSSNDVTKSYNNEINKLNQGFLSGKIGYEKYLKEKRQLEDKYKIDKDNADIKDDEDRLKNLRDYLQKELNLKIFFAEKELERAQKGGDDKEIADAKAKLDGLLENKKKAKAEEVALEEKTAKDITKKQADEAEKREKSEAKFKELKEQLAVESFNLAKTLVDASFENRINQIQEEIDQNDKKASAEIEAVQRSSISQRDKEAELIIIEANRRARETQLRNEQKQEKIKEAKFDRDVALAEIAWKTAEAIMGAMKLYGGSPIAWAVSAAIATLGAIQAATVLARPIPTYGDGIGIPGKGEHPGGLALTGERFELELVTIPGQKPFIVDKPTLLDMPAGSSVLPLKAQDIVHDLGWAGLMQGAALINSRSDNSSPVVDAINAQTVAMKRAYAQGQRKIQNIVNVHIDADWNNYVNKKIIGKA